MICHNKSCLRACQTEYDCKMLADQGTLVCNQDTGLCVECLYNTDCIFCIVYMFFQICDYGDFVDGQCLTTTTAAPETTTTPVSEDFGELIIIFDGDNEMTHWCYCQVDHNDGDVD